MYIYVLYDPLCVIFSCLSLNKRYQRFTVELQNLYQKKLRRRITCIFIVNDRYISGIYQILK